MLYLIKILKDLKDLKEQQALKALWGERLLVGGQVLKVRQVRTDMEYQLGGFMEINR